MSHEWLTPPEVARLLRCRESKVGHWIRSGRLAAVNVSDGQRPRFRVSKTALDDFLAAQAVAPESRPVRRHRREDVPRYV